MAKKPTKPAAPYPRVYETFSDTTYNMRQYEGAARPSCWNREVNIRRYRITVELVDEPKEVLVERLRKIWRSTDNHHHRDPLRTEAKRLGVELDSNEFGADMKRKT